MVVYSAHDTSMLFLYLGLDLTNLKCLENLIQDLSNKKLFTDLDTTKCLFSTDFAADFKLEMVDKNGKLFVVLKINNVYYKIRNPKGWSKLVVCGMKYI